MITELVITVSHVFRDGENRIAGGAESHFLTADLGWLDFMGKEVII